MANLIKEIKVNSQGVIELMKTQEMLSMLRREAQARGEIDTEYTTFDRHHVVYKEK